MPRARRMGARERLLIIYLGIFMVSVFIFLGTAIANKMQFAGRPLERAVGTVVEKLAEGEARVLVVEVPLREDRSVRVEAPLAAEFWEGYAVGDRVGLLVRVNRSRRHVHVEEAGLHPLSVAPATPSAIMGTNQ